MSKIGTLNNIHQNKGEGAVINAIEKAMIDSTLAPYLKSALGKRLHQKIYMYFRLGYWPQIREPRTYNEKLLYRKLYTNNDLFSVVEDKWRVRDYVADKIGEDILPEVYHVTDDPETIPFDQLPEEYVIKPTHMSGPLTIIDQDDEPDTILIKQSCREWLSETYGTEKEEYWYNKIKPRIIVEEKLSEKEYALPRDFKFYVFHSEVKYIAAYQKETTDSEKTLNFYDNEWNPVDIVEKEYIRGPEMSKPKTLTQMIHIAESLGEDFDHIRVDLYTPNEEEVVFGELSVAEGSGGNPFVPRRYDFEFGSHW